jgi:hypothetical protein
MEFTGYEEVAVLGQDGTTAYYQLTMTWKEEVKNER